MAAPADNNTTRALLDTLARVLAPLLKLLIARGVTYQMASELLKRTYVDVAQRHYVDGDVATGTRLSLLTGLNRKEIRRLTTELADARQPEDMVSFAAATHAVWRSVRRWRDRDGRPKPLARRGGGRQPSFDDLVRSITLDHRPSAILDELLRLDYAHEDEAGYVHLNERAFLPQRAFEDKLLPLAENLEDHAAAAVDNVLSAAPAFLERSVFSDELSTESVERLATLTRQQWQQIHDAAIALAIAAEDEDTKAGRPRDQRIRLGMYFYAEKKDTE